MSLKQVLDTARRLGIPVVVTDEAGEAAQVVMPFEDFASMVGATSPAPRKPRVTRNEGKQHEGKEDEIAQALADLTFERVQHQTREDDSHLSRNRGVTGDDQGFLEDRFYLEPLDDERPI